MDDVRHLARPYGADVTAGAAGNKAFLSELSADLMGQLSAAHPDVRPLLVLPSKDKTGLVVETPASAVRVTTEKFSRDEEIPVEVRVYPEMGAETHASVVGGAQLNFTNGEAACTSGFTIDHPDRAPQLLTADHCSDDLNYGNNDWLELTGYEQGPWGDLQRHSSTQTEIPKFQFSQGLLTTNKSSTGYTPLEDGRYNRFGRNTSQSSVRVEQPIGVCIIYSVKEYCNLASTELGTTSVRGDSGGPWWAGASGGAAAVGIHSGCIYYVGNGCNLNITKRDLFTPAANLDDAFGTGWVYMTG